MRQRPPTNDYVAVVQVEDYFDGVSSHRFAALRGVTPRPDSGLRNVFTSSANLRRSARLAVDRLLSCGEQLYVAARGGRRRRREARDIDASGRSSLDALERLSAASELWDRAAAALERGATADVVSDAILTTARTSGERLAETLRRRAPQMLREHRAINRGMQRRSRAVWGPALDAMYELYVCIEEMGDGIARLNTEDSVTRATTALHGRACLLLLEVHTLLTQGFPNGAWARTRSLHENAVVAALLSGYGREAGSEDLAERFLRHSVVDELRDLKTARAAGADVADSDLACLQRVGADLVARVGRGYDSDFGWARPLVPSGPAHRPVPLVRLEELADAGLTRVEYRHGSHHVHSSARTIDLHIYERGGREVQLTGRTNTGLGAPAAVAMLAAFTSAQAAVFAPAGPVDPMNLVGLFALGNIIERANDLFYAGQALVDVREERLQRLATSTPTEQMRESS